MRSEPSYDDLAATLGVLASPARLSLLRALRTPQELNEIRLEVASPGDDKPRVASRQAVSHHLDALLDERLVRRLGDGASTRGALYVLDHQRLFAAVDDMRGLARLRPAIVGDAGATVAGDETDAARLPPRPRLVVAFGRENGVGHAVPTALGASVRIGRSPECEVCLDFDPFLSGVHASVTRGADGVVLRDLASRNGTWLNWSRVRPNVDVRLAAGDLLTVGRCVLAFQA